MLVLLLKMVEYETGVGNIPCCIICFISVIRKYGFEGILSEIDFLIVYSSVSVSRNIRHFLYNLFWYSIYHMLAGCTWGIENLRDQFG